MSFSEFHTSTGPTSVLQHAELYARSGLCVFPVAFKGKNPLTAHGFKDAASDPTQIECWFNNGPVNIAIRTGGLDGIAVVDIDAKSGGYESLELLKSKYGLNTDTLTVRTGGGGLHFYYRAEGSEKSRTGVLPGVDIKANGGYIIAPPSVHPSGDAYEFKKPFAGIADLKPFPTEIIAKVDNERKQSHKKSGAPDNGSKKVSEGERNSYLFAQFARLRGMGLGLDQIRARLHEINADECSPPLDPQEVETIIGRFKERSQKEILVYAPLLPADLK